MWEYKGISENNNFVMHRHTSFVDKKLVNGKWRYYYVNDLANPKEKGIKTYFTKTSGDPKDDYGTYTRDYRGEKDNIVRKKSNKLFSSEKTYTSTGRSGRTNSTRIENIGKIEQTANAADKKLNEISQRIAAKRNKKVSKATADSKTKVEKAVSKADVKLKKKTNCNKTTR